MGHHRHLLRLTATLALLACAANATITFVQSRQNATSAATNTLAYSAAVTAGDLLIVGYEINSAGTGTVTDSKGNTWQVAIGPSTDTNSQSVALVYAVAASSGSDTVTLTLNTANYSNLVIAEYSGTATVSVVDGTGGSASGSGTTASTGSFAVGNSNSLVAAMGMMAGGSTTVGSGYTSRGTDGFSMFEDKIAGGTSVTATLTGTVNDWVIVGIGFKPTGASPTMVPRHRANICCAEAR